MTARECLKLKIFDPYRAKLKEKMLEEMTNYPLTKLSLDIDDVEGFDYFQEQVEN